jgi:hypothetical protein
MRRRPDLDEAEISFTEFPFESQKRSQLNEIRQINE